MGFDEMKEKASGLADEHGDKIQEGVEKAGDFVDDKTGGKFSEHVDTAQEKAGDFVDDLGSGGGDAGDQGGEADQAGSSDQADDTGGGLFDKAKDFFKGDK